MPKEMFTKYAGYSQSLQSIIYIFSPATAAFLYSVWELDTIIALDVLGVIIASITVTAVKIPILIMEQKSLNHNFAGEMRVSMEYFKGTPLHVSITEIAYASGMLLGGILLGLAGNYKKRIVLIAASIFAMSISLAISGLLPTEAFLIFVICCIIMGLSVPFYSGVQTVLFQEKIQPEYLGRVFSLTGSIISLAMPVGLILSGMFVDLIGVNTWFFISGILIMVIALICPIVPAVKSLDDK